MLKREVKYKNADDEDVTETLYFNLGKVDLIELEIDNKGGIRGVMEEMLREKDTKKLFQWLKRFILSSYGEKDGPYFRKSDEIRENFASTLAFDQLIYDLLSDSDAAADFLIGIMPQEYRGDPAKIKKEIRDQIAAEAKDESKAAETAPRPPTS